MASQISHIVYAERYLSKSLVKDANNFILGCVFPDIRRINKSLHRSDTHLYFTNIDLDFKKYSSFQAGWKFHLYCDKRREEILNKYNFYEIPETQNYAGLPAKLLEDEIVYTDFQNWEKLTNLFRNIPLIEEKITVPWKKTRIWYSFLAEYIEKKPEKKSIKKFLDRQDDLKKFSEEIIEIISKLRQNKNVLNILSKIKEEII